MKNSYAKIKRIQDVILSVLALIILLPLMIGVALLIYMDDSHGSFLYSQIRVGKNGKPFRMYKFRSMHVNADEMLKELYPYNEMDGPTFKMKNDPRVTKVGKWLRKTCIDELPQLWNVIRGEMSLVGPRPALPEEVKYYNTYQKKRLSVMPGLTCYWQICPNRHSLKFEEWIALDIKYINERSILTDWKIMMQTVKAILVCQGE